MSAEGVMTDRRGGEVSPSPHSTRGLRSGCSVVLSSTWGLRQSPNFSRFCFCGAMKPILRHKNARNRQLLSSLPISLQPLTSLSDSVSILRIDNNFSYPAVDLTRRTAIGLSRLPVRLSGTRYLTNSKIRLVVLTVLNSSSRQTCSVFTNVTSTLEVSLKRYAALRYINLRFTYLLTRRYRHMRVQCNCVYN